MQGLEKPALASFIEQLRQLDLNRLQLSAYNTIYLKKHLNEVHYSVCLALQIIELGTHKLKVPKDELRIVEIGGGTGILTLLALHLGYKNTIYSDVYEDSCLDFKKLALAMDLHPLDIVRGSIEEVAAKHSEPVHLIVSRDVVEHIYKPDLFFKNCVLFYKHAVHVHNTSANKYNIFKRKYFKKLHHKDEWEGNPDQFKPGDSVEPFFELRKKFIQSHFPDLSGTELIYLSSLTRGETYADIQSEVENYLNNQKPVFENIGSNTCDPATGNWSEHLMSLKQYESFVKSRRYRTRWHFSPYDVWSHTGLNKLIRQILNRMIQLLGHQAKWIAPAIIMVARPKAISANN